MSMWSVLVDVCTIFVLVIAQKSAFVSILHRLEFHWNLYLQTMPTAWLKLYEGQNFSRVLFWMSSDMINTSLANWPQDSLLGYHQVLVSPWSLTTASLLDHASLSPPCPLLSPLILSSPFLPSLFSPSPLFLHIPLSLPPHSFSLMWNAENVLLTRNMKTMHIYSLTETCH